MTERMLLSGLYDNSIGESNHVAAVMNPDVTTVGQDESVERVARLLAKDAFIVVEDHAGIPVGVVTGMDLIDYFV